MGKKNKEYFKNLKKLLLDRSNFWLPSSLAYYFVLALIPTIFLIQVLFAYFKISDTFILQYIQLLIPEINQEIFVNFVHQSNTFTKFSFIIIFLLSYNVIANGILSFLRMTNRLYGFKKISSLDKRIKAYLITMYLLILILIFAIINNLVANFFILYLKIDIYNYFSDLLVFVTIFVVIIFFYYITPIVKIRFKKLLPGTLFSSLSVTLILKIFNFLSKSIINFNNVYGPLSFLVSLLLLCYFVLYMIFIGLGINVINYKMENITNNTGC